MGDLAIVNAHILSMDAQDHTWDALLARDGVVVRVGTEADILAARDGAVPVIDLDGRTVVPGFIDPHQHFSMSLFEPVQVDCRTPPIESLDDVLERLAEAASDETLGRWIRGWGFHWSRVHEQRSPSRADLDRIAPRNPVILMDASYHGCFVNSQALDLAGIDRHSQPGRAGIIVLDDDGEVEGTLLETAMDRPESLSWASYVGRDQARSLDLVEALCRRQLELGITSVTDALVLPGSVELYRLAAEQGRLPITLGGLVGGRTFFDPPDPTRPADDRLGAFGERADMIKVFVDVVHPSPAIDRPGHSGPETHTGVNYYGRGELSDLVRAAVDHGIGVAMHALGNCAIDVALDACAAVRGTRDGNAATLRIEHFVLASREQAARAADLGVAVVTNPGFVDTWGDQYLERWSIRGRPDLRVLPIRDLLDAGVATAAASDYPCDELDPLHGIWAAVARQSWTGDDLYPEQAITPTEALRLVTCGAANASGTQAVEGSLEPGKHANLVVLDRDPITCPTDALRSIHVERTYIGGALAFDRDHRPKSSTKRRSSATN